MRSLPAPHLAMFLRAKLNEKRDPSRCEDLKSHHGDARSDVAGAPSRVFGIFLVISRINTPS